MNANPALGVDQARDKLLKQIRITTEQQEIAVADSLGRTSADAVLAQYDIPHFRNSAMDGYAIRHQDIAKHQRFTVSGVSLAGKPHSVALAAAEAIRITTGARVPDNADTIVIKENVKRDNNVIELLTTPTAMAHVRNPGDDIVRGSTLVAKHEQLGPGAMGMLAAQGQHSIHVLRKPAVGIFSTGDELRNAGESLSIGQIYDSNRMALCAMLTSIGASVTDLGIVRDNRQAITDALEKSGEFDFLVSSGGVSVGEADYVKPALENSGELLFWKIAMKPGKPLVTAKLKSGAWFFGLPGNPVSSIVTCTQFVIPALQKFSARTFSAPLRQNALLLSTVSKEPGRFEFQRGIAHRHSDGRLEVDSTGLQDSHVLSSIQAANCFICLDQPSNGAKIGETVKIILFSDIPGLRN